MDYTDDDSIEPTAELWRRVRPEHMVPGDELGMLRPSSAAFHDSSDNTPMSVDLASIVRSLGGDERTVLAPYPGFYLVSLTAAQVRSRQLGVCREPLPDNPAHAYVFGKKTGSVRKYLAKCARRLV